MNESAKYGTYKSSIEWFLTECLNTKIKPVTYTNWTSQPISSHGKTETKTKVPLLPRIIAISQLIASLK